MVDDESSRPPIASGRQTSESESAHDTRPFGQPDQIAAHIAEELRHSGVPCETVIPVPTQTAVLRRDRIVIVLALALLAALAWSYLLWLSADMDMGGMDMTGFRMIPSGMALMVPAHTPWLPIEFAFVFVMWVVMMVAMMTPSSVPMFLMYARVGRQTAERGRPLAATAWFATGYFLVWTAFALLVTLAQWAFERAALLDFKMASTDTVIAGLLFVAAGSYQWTNLKDICLAECRTPYAFLIRHGGLLLNDRASPRRVLRWLLLGTDAAVVRWRRDERPLDRPNRVTRFVGEGHLFWSPDCSPCWRGVGRGRRIVVVNGNILRIIDLRNAEFQRLCTVRAKQQADQHAESVFNERR